jgi:predicted DNA-binding transcriptional regulator AlpA
MSLAPEFPTPIRFGGRLRFDQREFENFKRALAGLPVAERDPQEPIRFIAANDVCADLGIDRRTLGRRTRGRIRE